MAPTKRYQRAHGGDSIRTKIESLALAGWRPSAIGKALERSTTYVCVVLNQLRKAGRLPQSQKPAQSED